LFSGLLAKPSGHPALAPGQPPLEPAGASKPSTSVRYSGDGAPPGKRQKGIAESPPGPARPCQDKAPIGPLLSCCDKCSSERHSAACCPNFRRGSSDHPGAAALGAVPRIMQINKEPQCGRTAAIGPKGVPHPTPNPSPGVPSAPHRC
jgi:hypothetical protein